MYRIAVIGATGFAGQELVRILARHPRAELTVATGSQATSTPRRLPALARIWDGDVRPLDLAAVTAGADAAFLALPEAASAEVAPSLVAAGLRVVDLSAGGCRVITDGTPIIGEHVHLRVGRVSDYPAQVRWALGNEAGLKFTGPAEEID